MRIVYMGTPDIAVPTLRYLAESKHQVVGVLTQPDRPKGRGHHTIPTAVKAAALEYDIPVYQPLHTDRFCRKRCWNCQSMGVSIFTHPCSRHTVAQHPFSG